MGTNITSASLSQRATRARSCSISVLAPSDALHAPRGLCSKPAITKRKRAELRSVTVSR
jgi:hypothetical protein